MRTSRCYVESGHYINAIEEELDLQGPTVLGIHHRNSRYFIS